MEVIYYIGAAQSIFAAILLYTKRPKTTADKILVAWFLIIGGSMLNTIFNRNFGVKLYEGASLAFTYGPFIYLYVKYVISNYSKFRLKDCLHFFPAFFFFISLYFTNFTRYNYYVNDTLERINLYAITFLLLIIYYNYMIIKLLNRHNKNIKNNLSFSSDKINLNWLRYLSITFTSTFVLTISLGIIQTQGNEKYTNPGFILTGGFTFIAYLFCYFASKQPQIFNIAKTLEDNIKISTKHEKYERSGLKEDDIQQYLNKIIDHTETQKLYLKGDLTIQDLSESTHIPKHYITQILNEKLNKNFYTFINEYRVNSVKETFENPESEKLTLLAIAYDCGFNSKSSFNNIFKKFTGVTPSQYKKSLS